jgi:hypothetical protein
MEGTFKFPRHYYEMKAYLEECAYDFNIISLKEPPGVRLGDPSTFISKTI